MSVHRIEKRIEQRIPSARHALAACLVAIFWPCGQAQALGLVEAYEAALANDPVYQAAAYENEAGRQARALGRSRLLPNVSASFSAGKNDTELTTTTLLGPRTTHPRYDSRTSVLSVRQPVYSPEGVAGYRQGEAQADYSDAQFAGRRQELLLRVTSAYLNALLAEDQLALVEVQRNALHEQSRVNDLMFEKGEGTKTDMLETQAKLDLVRAQLIEAQDNLATARSTLAEIVGMEIERLDRVSNDAGMLAEKAPGFEHWQAMALENNFELAAQRHAVEVALQEVKKAKAGHYPRLDMIASYSKNTGESITNYDQASRGRSVGLQLTIPIYAGGQVSALATQAAANHKKAQAELAALLLKTQTELRKQYELLQSGVKRIQALVKAVDSASMMVDATERSVKGGLRINLDVLNAQQQLIAARRDLAQARYNHWLAYLRLRSTAGVLRSEDLHHIAR